MNMEKEIYRPNPMEILVNRYWELQRLSETGVYVDNLLEDTWTEIKDIIEQQDAVKIKDLRGRIKDIIKEQNEP